MKRDVNETERTTQAAVKALRISMCEFQTRETLLSCQHKLKQIWDSSDDNHRLSQLFVFDCDD